MELSLNVILWCVRDICTLWEELPQEPVGVLVGSAFPWMVRSGKIEWHVVKLFAELSMLCEFLSTIRCHGSMRLSPEHFSHNLVDCNSGLARSFSAKQVPALAIHQRDKAGSSLLADHGICLPMATDGAFFCTGRAFLDGMRDDEFPTTFFRSLLVAALSMMTQSPKDELRRCPCRIQQASTDRAVDGRGADNAVAMLQLDAADNLFRRPVVLQDADLYKGAQGCILQALVWLASGSAPLITGLRNQRHGIGCLDGAALRRSSREMVDLPRLSRCAISVMDLPPARKKSIFSRSNGVRWV